MSEIERGKVVMSVAVAEKVADALGVPLSTLFRDVEKLRTKGKKGHG